MATMNISLPDQMKEWVETRVAQSGRYANVSDYMRDLIREEQDRDRAAIDWWEERIREGIESGPAEEVDFDDLLQGALAEARTPPKSAAK